MWQQLVVMLIMNLVSSALSAAAAPKPAKPKAGKLQIPTATEGDSFPFVFGTVLLKSPVVHWSGGQRAIAYRKKGGKK